jgi:APA family basic amino acid/polyamine antiporter
MIQNKLNQGLGLKEAIALVVGTIIGTGVFMKTGIMSQTVGSAPVVMLAWVVAGLLSLAGALTYAELGGLFPKAGGEFVYLREAYGNVVGFLYGWMRFWIGSPGSIAAYAVGAATFLGGFIHYENSQSKVIMALLFIVFFTLLNCLNVRFGGRLQTLLTALKVLMLAVIALGIFCFSPGSFSDLQATGSGEWAGWSAFGAAMLAALWAYDGWNNLPMVAGEVKNGQRNVPLALAFGTLAILLIYGIVNLSYFYALPFSEILTASSKLHPDALPVATKAASTFLGTAGIGFLSIAFVISALGAMNGSILTGARVPYAMATERLFFAKLGELHPKTHVPMYSVLIQGLWACVLAMSGTFDQLTDYVVFSSWLFYALCGASVWIFRKKLPNRERPYKVLFYPVLPIVFVLCASLLLINTLITSPQESLFGLIIIGIGFPAYWFFFRKNSLGAE